ncbi:DsbA family protein [Anabaena cylindrica FACHB-243]|uniref:DSBA oxidoreductase n=1 Tax=Anabaena cylindrica (strain ATCC 27899 / PCC 7122) TaxID=272123 RepID=K9ZIJ8_ANACC|nr:MULTISPECIES: DsbA family protein [Anabaena]AFZ59026.1 DSBA oxidoreductase [Anabaena cylindrica PCC 7122]MBD2420634.1 DsbA family protein [Anabaena cylindrica FACHB-243]MBY5283830.1 DsbA family protein [Anabaena sp. CCAP 1446/1C]MBY5309736.1 DsbA family protein [Anabaena sp. CCAP 1446/1C]MCM2408594.1 DsbA family protein [Anabaena sp. CCAP 1446/1C]
MLKIFQNLRIWTITSLLCFSLSWSLPAQADTKIDPQLEQQVLQIIRKNPEVIIETVQAYQQEQQQKVQQVRQEFLQNFRTNTKAVIGDSPTTGSTQLNTVLLEFSDFECPYCAEAHKTLKDLLAKYPNQFTLVYKHFPLVQIHDQALPSAKASWAAYQQGKFWEYHDALFTNQKQLGETLYLDIAKNLKLDLAKFKTDRNLADKAIKQDLQMAYKLGLSGTPSLIINSKNVSGPIQLSEVESILQGGK